MKLSIVEERSPTVDLGAASRLRGGIAPTFRSQPIGRSSKSDRPWQGGLSPSPKLQTSRLVEYGNVGDDEIGSTRLRTKSLERRQAVSAAMLTTLAERVSPTLADLSRAVGVSEGRVGTRLGKLAAMGFAFEPDVRSRQIIGPERGRPSPSRSG